MEGRIQYITTFNHKSKTPPKWMVWLKHGIVHTVKTPDFRGLTLDSIVVSDTNANVIMASNTYFCDACFDTWCALHAPL